MSAQDAIDFVSDDIAEVGELMRSLSGRYEGIFGNFRAACGVVCERAPNLHEAARDIAEKALDIAGDICIYTNHFHTIEELPSKA